jgi:hypothetical protein
VLQRPNPSAKHVAQIYSYISKRFDSRYCLIALVQLPWELRATNSTTLAFNRHAHLAPAVPMQS